MDATLLQAARRAPAKEDKAGGDGDAGYTVKQGQPHYGYKGARGGGSDAHADSSCDADRILDAGQGRHGLIVSPVVVALALMHSQHNSQRS